MVPLLFTFTPDSPQSAALRTVLASIAVGLIPGLLVCALAGPLAAATMLEWFGLAFGVSFVIVQAMTIVAVLGHVSASRSLKALWTICGLISVYLLFYPRRNRLNVAAAHGHWVIWLLLAVLAVCLYIQSPSSHWISGEDALHLGVIRRLMTVDRPALDNLYWANGLTYTYPFPATHFFMGLVSRAAHLDPLLVYQKIRWFWAPAAFCLLYATARLVFNSERIAFASALTAVLLTLNGTFGPIASTWGQLAPSSHASDVAMTLLLPALVLFALHFVQARDARTSGLFLAATLSLALTLAIVHVRELVQFLVYAGATCTVFALMREHRRLAIRFGVLVAATLVLAEAYLVWHRHTVGHIDVLVVQRRAMLVEAARTLPWLDYVRAPFSDPYFVASQEYFFYQWFPVVLFLAPIVLVAYASQPLVAFVGASMLAYLLIVRLPLVAIPYVYATYYEILFTPVRNFLLFIYMIAGPLLLVFADALPRRRLRLVQLAGSLAIVGALWFAYTHAGTFFAAHQELFLLPMIAAIIVVLVGQPPLTRLRRWFAAGAADRASLPLSFYVLVAGVTLVSLHWANSPLNFDWASARWTTREYIGAMVESTGQSYAEFVDPASGEKYHLADPSVRQAAPSPDLLVWARQSLPTEAVIVSNLFNPYALPVFLPQQIPMWPIADGGSTIDFNARLVPAAYGAFLRVVRKYEAQPFFNEKETLDERLAYLRAVGGTHLLIDPRYYASIRPLVGRWPDRFASLYDDGQRWAVFQIRHQS
jgi:hypothetical protein